MPSPAACPSPDDLLYSFDVVFMLSLSWSYFEGDGRAADVWNRRTWRLWTNPRRTVRDNILLFRETMSEEDAKRSADVRMLAMHVFDLDAGLHHAPQPRPVRRNSLGTDRRLHASLQMELHSKAQRINQVRKEHKTSYIFTPLQIMPYQSILYSRNNESPSNN